MSTRQLLRLLWRDRATTLVAAAVLALGIGASTAMFTVVNATLLRPRPYPGAERLVTLRVISPEFRDRYPSFPANARHVDEWRRECRGCEELAAFSFFGVQPMIGRVFLPRRTTGGTPRRGDQPRAVGAPRQVRTSGAPGGTSRSRVASQ